MNNTQELLKYIESGFKPHDIFMSAKDDKIRYIYERPRIMSALNRASASASLIGIYANDTFYSLSPAYKEAGKDFMEELHGFEDLYNDLFTKELNRYSSKEPIGGKISDDTAKRLNLFIDRDLQRTQTDIIFGNRSKNEKPIDHKKFEPLFLRYIVSGADFLTGQIRKDIEERADELNFLIMSEDLAYKYAAELLRDEIIVERISIYGKIKQLKYPQYRISVKYESSVLENIAIDKDRLLRAAKYNEDISGSSLSAPDRRRLSASGVDLDKFKFNFDNMVKIEYGSYVLYEKSV